ncbi:MAG: translation initiation factor IF-2 subunit beta [Nanoarchaeota archaeon]|nr:translation initiation factor IF-2 subunit beta [Nanoarchaeota archaeon]
MGNYEQLLNEAYKNVKQVECGERFEVPKVNGRHEGTKTVITNFLKIVSCLRRSQEHVLKFLGKELASSGEISGERLIFSRKLSSREINEKIEKYVNSFVICSRCKKPDTELTEEGNKIFLKCLACGEKHEVHKL